MSEKPVSWLDIRMQGAKWIPVLTSGICSWVHESSQPEVDHCKQGQEALIDRNGDAERVQVRHSAMKQSGRCHWEILENYKRRQALGKLKFQVFSCGNCCAQNWNPESKSLRTFTARKVENTGHHTHTHQWFIISLCLHYKTKTTCRTHSNDLIHVASKLRRGESIFQAPVYYCGHRNYSRKHHKQHRSAQQKRPCTCCWNDFRWALATGHPCDQN